MGPGCAKAQSTGEAEAFDCLESIDASRHVDINDVLDAAHFHDAHHFVELSVFIQSKFKIVWTAIFYWTDHKDQDENALKVYQEGSQDPSRAFCGSPSRTESESNSDWSDA